MTVSKAERRRRAVEKSASELQDARDLAYSSMLNLYSKADAHALLCERLAVEAGEQPKSIGYERISSLGSWFAPHTETESVVHWCLQSHRIIGRSALTQVMLPDPVRRIPAPAGATGFIR